MPHTIKFPNHPDSGRTSIGPKGPRSKFQQSELGQFLAREEKVYPTYHKLIPENWSAGEISNFIAELTRIMAEAAHKGDTYWPVMLACVGKTSNKRVIALDVYRDTYILNKDDSVVLRTLQGKLPEGEDFTIYPWVLAGKELDYPRHIATIESLLKRRFLNP